MAAALLPNERTRNGPTPADEFSDGTCSRSSRRRTDAMRVSYARQTVDAPNPIARFAHRRRIAISLRTASGIVAENASVLDYGCGSGLFLRQLGERRPDIRLLGYDPYFATFSNEPQHGFEAVDDVEVIASATVDLMTALETLEHLTDAELVEFIAHVKRILAPSGKLLVSVPVIGGPGLVVKEVNRMLLHRRMTDYTPIEFARAVLLGRPGHRRDVKASHKGFDFKALRRIIGEHLDLEREWLAPLPKVPWPLNSQHFSIWQR
ncbi:MAG: class I SAM-dependent methyltransferase [Pseudonocardia sp.]|nr:class I SAM-dependent methyltransferase [Pseudonocardia sp.]